MNALEDIECDCLEDNCPAESCREMLAEIKRDARQARRDKQHATPAYTPPYQRIRETPALVVFDTAGILRHVSESTLKHFLSAVAGSPTDSPQIVEAKGRCVRVLVTGPSFTWHEKAETLLGTCNPVERFRLDGNYVIACLKTDAQMEADNAAADIDEAGELKTYWPFFDDDAAAPAVMRTKSDIKAAKKKKTRTVPEGKVAPAVLRVMERDCPIGAMDREELIALTKATLEPDVDARGDDRRRKYIKQAIDALVKRDFLRVCGEDDEQLELTDGNT